MPTGYDNAGGSGVSPLATTSAGTRTYSAIPPGVTSTCSSQTAWWPCVQAKHSRQGTWLRTTTRSPSAQPAARDSVTPPLISCPRIRGAFGSRNHSATSLPQMPQASTRTSTSPAPIRGRSTASTRTELLRW